MNSVREFLKNLNIVSNSTIVVGVSYGPDSMALLDVLKRTYKNNKIVCAHVHHNHRKESDHEALLLRKYCESNHIIFEMMKIDKYDNDRFTEEQARKKRYDFFDEIVKKYESKYLFTAHHGDDLVETIMMRLVRGSSFKGYSGIHLTSARVGYQIIRPFLYVTKEELLLYCSKHNIPYAIDHSNKEEEYTRNRFRKQVLPFLKGENASVNKQFLKFSETITEYYEHVEKEVNTVYNDVVLDGVINLDKLSKYDNVIIKTLLQRFLFEEYGDEIKNVNDVNLQIILKSIHENKPNITINLPRQRKLIKSYNNLFFDKSEVYNDYCFVFDDYVSLPNNYYLKKINKLENTSNYVTALLSSEIHFPIYVRNKLDGDVISVLGFEGTKKINRVLIDEKVPKVRRAQYPVVVDANGTIIWLPGLKKTKYDKSKTGNYDIILKYHKEEKDDTTK